MRAFLLVGLTGGIATGKSTVSAMLASPSVRVIDADVLARDAVLPGTPTYARIVTEFGREVLQADGHLDRAKLGAVVFHDPARRKRLEEITHPAIRARLEKILAQFEHEAFDGIVIWNAALLIESGSTKQVDRVIVVVTDPATQIRRLMERDGIPEEAARARIATQMPLAVKARYADYVIDNSGSRADTERQVRDVYRALLGDLRTRPTRSA